MHCSQDSQVLSSKTLAIPAPKMHCKEKGQITPPPPPRHDFMLHKHGGRIMPDAFISFYSQTHNTTNLC